MVSSKAGESRLWGALCPLAIAVAAAPPALAAIGDPMGALPGGTHGQATITVTQGGLDVLSTTDFLFPADIKTTGSDGDPEDYVILDTWAAGTPDETDIILKIVSDDDPAHPGNPYVDFRITHWYIDAVVPGDIHTAGPLSLFTPGNANLIEVEIENVAFVNTQMAIPLQLDQDDYLVSYMRNGPEGYFYKFQDANDFGQYIPGVEAIQVPGSKYLDGVTSYSFWGTPGGTASWTWSGIIPPDPDPDPLLNTPAIDEFGGSHGGDGHVHELGLGVSFVGELVPEPATLVMMLLTPLMLRPRRRHR